MKSITLKFSMTIMILLGIISFSYSQNSKTWEWAKNIAGTNINYSYALFTDKEGNNYIAGGFTDTLNVGSTILISKGSYDIYLLKYNTNGDLIWAIQAGGNDSDEAYGIASDASGNLYLTGYFSETANFSGTQVKSKGYRDFFVAKYSSNGELVWVRNGDGNNEAFGTAITADRNGNVFVSGIFKDTMNIGNLEFISKGNEDVFIVRYNKSGEVVWSTTGGGNMADKSTSIITDFNGNVYVTGDFERIAKFNQKEIVSSGKKDIFIAKYNNDGVIQWLKREGSATGDDHASSIALDNSENIYITGYFSGLAKFGISKLKNIGSDDIFLVKYNPDGGLIWVKQTGGKGNKHARALILDKDGNIYVTGVFNVDFTFAENNIKNLGEWDIFILKYNQAGQMISGTQIGGTGYDKPYGIGIDGLSNIYTIGFFNKAISIGNTNLTSIDADDSFIAKLKNF